MPMSNSRNLYMAVWTNSVTEFTISFHAALAFTTLMSNGNTHTNHLTSCSLNFAHLK